MKHVKPSLSLFRFLILSGFFLCPRSTVSGDGTSVPEPTVVATRQTGRPGEFRKSVKIAFYNVESFYDTIRNPMIDDGDYTPAGRAHWDSDRYRTKIEHIARVLDDLNADLTGLCEFENESVLRDLLLEMKTSCNYIYRAAPDRRGMDLALLYRGDTFFPDQIYRMGGPGISRDFLVITGRLLEQQVILMVCHMPSMMNDTGYRNRAASTLGKLLGTLTTGYPAQPVILMGDFNAAPDSRLVRKGIGIGDASRPPTHPMPPMIDQIYGRSMLRRLAPVTSDPPLYTPFFILSRKGFARVSELMFTATAGRFSISFALALPYSRQTDPGSRPTVPLRINPVRMQRNGVSGVSTGFSSGITCYGPSVRARDTRSGPSNRGNTSAATATTCPYGCDSNCVSNLCMPPPDLVDLGMKQQKMRVKPACHT